MRNKLIGIIIFVVIVIAAIGYTSLKPKNVGVKTTIPKTTITLNGLVGGEKLGLLDDIQVQSIMATKYNIKLNYAKAGSLDMVQGDVSKDDFLFPASQTALDIYKSNKGKLAKSQEVLVSPIVFYSWGPVTDALIKLGIVQIVNNSYYIVDMPKMTELLQSSKKWSDIGVTDLYGKVTVMSTDPVQSNSGNAFSALLATIMNGGDIPDVASIDKVIPQVKSFFSRLGYMPTSSADLFNDYITKGLGADPIMVGYENQIIEYAAQNPAVWAQNKSKIRILYPTPTIWSNHIVMELNDKSTSLIAALEDPAIQKIAWEKHGFRTALTGVQNDVKALSVTGIPQDITKVIPMPNAATMLKLINALK